MDMNLKEIENFISKQKVSFVCSVDHDGFPNVKAMLKPRKRNGLKEFWFSTNTSSMRVRQYLENPRASIYFCRKGLIRYEGVMLKGTMEVLLVSPTKPLMIIIAKAVPYLVLAFVILIIILLMARFVLGVPLEGSLFWIFVISTVYIMLALSLGLLVSNVAQTQLVALLLSAMVMLMPIVMLSGMIFPVESMPMILQWVSAIIPTRYYISAMRKLMVMGVGAEQVFFELAVLTGMLIALLALSLATFKKRLE